MWNIRIDRETNCHIVAVRFKSMKVMERVELLERTDETECPFVARPTRRMRETLGQYTRDNHRRYEQHEFARSQRIFIESSALRLADARYRFLA